MSAPAPFRLIAAAAFGTVVLGGVAVAQQAPQPVTGTPVVTTTEPAGTPIKTPMRRCSHDVIS